MKKEYLCYYKLRVPVEVLILVVFLCICINNIQKISIKFTNVTVLDTQNNIQNVTLPYSKESVNDITSYLYIIKINYSSWLPCKWNIIPDDYIDSIIINRKIVDLQCMWRIECIA